MKPKEAMHLLEKELANRPPGLLKGDNSRVLQLLVEGWGYLTVSEKNNGGAKKLLRAENLRWDPPILRFDLERHGGTVLGSSRAGLHKYTLDLDSGKAEVDTRHFRQLTPRARPFTAKIATNIAYDVISAANGATTDDERFKVDEDGYIVLNLSACLGDLLGSNEQTRAGRRKKLKNAISEVAEADGWEVLQKGNRLALKKRL